MGRQSGLNCETKTPCLGIATTPIGFPGVVFAGSVDGYVRAYDSSSGNVLWRFNTARQFTSTNGEIAKGGGVARNGVMIANGMLYVSSGFYQKPGNVLLAFSVDRNAVKSRPNAHPRRGLLDLPATDIRLAR